MNRVNMILGAEKILSVNSLYNAMIKYVGGRQVPVIYKSAQAKKTEAYIKEQVQLLDIPNNYPWIGKDTLFNMSIQVGFRSGYLLRDLDNCIKLLQDGIFRALDINDSHVVEIEASKKLLPGISEEKIFVCLEEVNRGDLRFDVIPKPRVFWCGDEDTWAGLELPEYPEKRARSDKRYKTKDQTTADSKIFWVPRELTPSTFIRVYDGIDWMVSEGRGFAFIGIETPSAENQEDIDYFISLLQGLSEGYSGIRFKILDNKKELYKWILE